jgi:hypothetical protein
MIGDSCLETRSKPNGAHHIRFQDKQNVEYVKWKLDKLDMFSFYENKISQHDVEVSQYVSETRHEFTAWKRKIGNRYPLAVIDEMDDLSLAVWFMDDGHGKLNDGHCSGSISVKRMRDDLDGLLELKKRLEIKGLDCSFNITEGLLRFNKDAFLLLCERICKFIPECMQYKLPPEFRGRYEEFDLDFEPSISSDYVRILSISDGSRRKFRQKGKYDLSIEGTHNYLVGNVANGVVVHNSNESEPGGKAVQFYPDLKIKMHINRAQSKIVEETHVSGEGIDRYIVGKATVLKNKAGPCFRTIPFRVWLDEQGAPGRGIDPVFDIHTFLVNCGLIEELSKTHFGIKLKGWETQKFDWKKFKSLVLVDAEGHELRNQINDLMASGKAQEMYYQYLATQMGVTKVADKDAGENIEVVEI